jgi:hypothetical protein
LRPKTRALIEIFDRRTVSPATTCCSYAMAVTG